MRTVNEIRKVIVDDKVYPLSITAEHKDKVLNALITKAAGKGVAILEYRDIANEAEMSEQQYNTIITEFQDKNMITHQGYSTRYTLMSKIYEYYNHGGFKGEETILLANLDKLYLEIESLMEQLTPTLAERLKPKLEGIAALINIIKPVLSIVLNE
ncbi:MAG: hypothetical protein LBM06_05685 [Prevotellaceae bacterium]|jgi:hypothetical protein|nr:hypothetical protein [Prevotellaceae bacterium]